MPGQASHLHGLCLKTNNAEQAAAVLGNSAVPYRFELVNGDVPFSTEILILRGRSMVVSTASTKGKMRLESCTTEDSFGLVLDLGTGVGPHRSAGKTVEVGSDFSFVQNASTSADVVTLEKYRVLFLRIGAEAIQQELEMRLAQSMGSKILFQPGFNMRTSGGQKLRALCEELRRLLSLTEREGLSASATIAHLESQIIQLLLEAQPHNYSRLMARFCNAAPWQLRAAEEFMRGCAHLPLSLGDICAAAGVNARTLQNSFRRHRGCSPMNFLHRIRMESVRADLLSPEDKMTVASQAAKWGFSHFGRFSQSYRIAFGERPSETLRRARKDHR